MSTNTFFKSLFCKLYILPFILSKGGGQTMSDLKSRNVVFDESAIGSHFTPWCGKIQGQQLAEYLRQRKSCNWNKLDLKWWGFSLKFEKWKRRKKSTDTSWPLTLYLVPLNSASHVGHSKENLAKGTLDNLHVPKSRWVVSYHLEKLPWGNPAKYITSAPYNLANLKF